MPFALLTISCELTVDAQKEIAAEAMRILSDVIGKPVSYCAAQVVLSVGGMGGDCQKSAFVDVRSIGGLKGKQQALSKAFSDLLKTKASIEPRCVYLNFTEMTGSNWGYNGSTF